MVFPYPLLAGDAIYVRNATGDDGVEALTTPVARALLVLSAIQQMIFITTVRRTIHL